MAVEHRSGGDGSSRKQRCAGLADGWQDVFLAALASTSNVAASAREAQVPPARAYEARRGDPTFFARWQAALCEGYDHLEMQLLQRLRDGEIKPASGAKRGTRTFDNATALRLLIAHRETAARQRAIASDGNAETVLAAIDAKIEALRSRTRDLPASPTDGDQGDAP